MAHDPTGVKKYLRRKFSVGGGGASYNLIAYAAGETGLKAFADAVWLDGAYDHIVITQNGFEGGYATGTEGILKSDLLSIIEDIITELGFGVTAARQAMIFADYSQGIAS